MTTSLIDELPITHQGAVDGATGSCHRLTVPGDDAVLVACGLFQGAETDGDCAGAGYVGPKGGYVVPEGLGIDIRAGFYTLGGLSARADQRALLGLVNRDPQHQRQVRIVHGEETAKRALAQRVRALGKNIEVVIP